MKDTILQHKDIAHGDLIMILLMFGTKSKHIISKERNDKIHIHRHDMHIYFWNKPLMYTRRDNTYSLLTAFVVKHLMNYRSLVLFHFLVAWHQLYPIHSVNLDKKVPKNCFSPPLHGMRMSIILFPYQFMTWGLTFLIPLIKLTFIFTTWLLFWL